MRESHSASRFFRKDDDQIMMNFHSVMGSIHSIIHLQTFGSESHSRTHDDKGDCSISASHVQIKISVDLYKVRSTTYVISPQSTPQLTSVNQVMCINLAMAAMVSTRNSPCMTPQSRLYPILSQLDSHSITIQSTRPAKHTKSY